MLHRASELDSLEWPREWKVDILGKEGGNVYACFIWLRIGTSGGLL